MRSTGDVEHRGESDLERADRNWNELLGELRVTQTGVAILFSLLLTVPFSARFEDLEREVQHGQRSGRRAAESLLGPARRHHQARRPRAADALRRARYLISRGWTAPDTTVKDLKYDEVVLSETDAVLHC